MKIGNSKFKKKNYFLFYYFRLVDYCKSNDALVNDNIQQKVLKQPFDVSLLFLIDRFFNVLF